MWKKMYLVLFNAITEALQLLEARNVWDAKKVLMEAQREAEGLYISAENSWEDDEDEIRILPQPAMKQE